MAFDFNSISPTNITAGTLTQSITQLTADANWPANGNVIPGMTKTVTTTNRPHLIIVSGVYYGNNTGATQNPMIELQEDGVKLQRAIPGPCAQAQNIGFSSMMILRTPTAGSHTYRVVSQAGGDASGSSFLGGIANPSLIIIELVG